MVNEGMLGKALRYYDLQVFDERMFCKGVKELSNFNANVHDENERHPYIGHVLCFEAVLIIVASRFENLIVKRHRLSSKGLRFRSLTLKGCSLSAITKVCFSAGNGAVFIGRKTQRSLGAVKTDIQEKDKNQSQNDKTEHENGKTMRSQKDQVKERNQDSSRKTINVEETSSKAMVAINGAGFDWSYMEDDEVPTNMALMAFSDSKVHNDKTCSKTCLKSFETLKTQLDDLRIEFNKSEFNLATYKRGLASVEEQLVFYKKNEVIFCEQLAVLKRDISYKDSELSMLKSELEKLKQEKESNQLKIENFDNASKSLDKLIGSQIPDKSRKGLGFVSYNAVPPPPTGLFSPPNLDLSNSGLEEFQQPEFEGYRPKTSKNFSEDTSNEVRESPIPNWLRSWCNDN
ncbi:hypothetical protein Tco_0535926 [Tanacetum coccineum]